MGVRPDTLSTALWHLAAQASSGCAPATFYRYVADHTSGKFMAEARLYNLEQARYLEEDGELLPPTLPDFIRTLKK